MFSAKSTPCPIKLIVKKSHNEIHNTENHDIGPFSKERVDNSVSKWINGQLWNSQEIFTAENHCNINISLFLIIVLIPTINISFLSAPNSHLNINTSLL